MRICAALFFLFITGPGALSSPAQIDSLESLLNTATGTERMRVLNSLSFLYGTKSPERCIELASQALELAKKENDETGMFNAHTSLAKGYHFANDLDAALEHHQETLALAKKLGRREDIAYSLLLMGNEHFSRQDHDNALKWYLESLEFSEGVDYKRGISNAANNVGSVSLRMKDYNKAIQYYKIAEETGRLIGDKRGIASALNNIGIIYDDFLHEFDKALEYYNEALLLFEEIEFREGEYACLNNIGLIYTRLEDYDTALHYYETSLQLSREDDNRWHIGNTSNNISLLHLEKDNCAQAREYAERALQIAEEISAIDLARDAHLALSGVEEKFGAALIALQHFKEHVALNDSIFSEERSRQMAEMQTKYETEKKKREIEILRKEKAIQELELNRQRNIRNFLIVCSALVLILVAVTYNRYVLKKRTSDLLEQKNRELEAANSGLRRSEENLKELNATKDRFFSIIAHDLKNPMNTFLGFSELLSDSFEEFREEQVREFIQIIHKSAKNLFGLLENLLQWSRSQTGRMIFEPQEIDVATAVAEDLPLLEASAEMKKIQLTSEIQTGTVVYADPRMVATVIRNLLSNAIKYTKSGGEVRMTSRETGEFVEISVTDSGIGINHDNQRKLFRIDVHHITPGTSEEHGTGLGLILCKDFVEKNGGTIWVQSEEGKGSTFAFTLPKTS